MFGILYDFVQVCGALLMTPRIVRRFGWRRWLYYIGWRQPGVCAVKEGDVFLLYAVSVGETKALASLFLQLKQANPHGVFYIASGTQTGQDEAKKSMPEADGYFFLPFDFSWTMRSFLKRLKVKALFIVESDFWYHFLFYAKKQGAVISVVSARISDRSYKRLAKVRFFSKRLFSFFDFIGAQNRTYASRFTDLGAKYVAVTGNLKFGQRIDLLSDKEKKELKNQLGLLDGDFVIVAGSLHAPEEKCILLAMEEVWRHFPRLRLLLVPRHPSRFEEVKALLQGSSFICFSSLQKKTTSERIVLVDAMGLLSSFYQIADLAICGGSFMSFLKGHNILEPIYAGVPVLFGPYMSDQKDLEQMVLSKKAGMQVYLEDLTKVVLQLIRHQDELFDLRIQGERLLPFLDQVVANTLIQLPTIASIITR